ncbi:hypothetical protein SDC9_133933 [bioreactor metagenome]|uniref:Uncharacterized protein n=1 Tax=bioreactor metagenome TaxID=1076179 RepID=A0A645DBZ5_9ZZZZ
MSRVLLQLPPRDQGPDGRVRLEVLQHLHHAHAGVVNVSHGGYDAQGNAVLVGVEKAAADAPGGGRADEHPAHAGGAFQTEPVAEPFPAQGNDLLGAHGDLHGVQFLLHAQLLRQQRVHAVGQNHRVRLHFLLTGDDPADLTASDNEIVHPDTADIHGALGLRLLSQPSVKFAAQDGVGRRPRRPRRLRRFTPVLHRGDAGFGHQRNPFLGDSALHRGTRGKVGNNLRQAVAVDAPSGYIL